MRSNSLKGCGWYFLAIKLRDEAPVPYGSKVLQAVSIALPASSLLLAVLTVSLSLEPLDGQARVLESSGSCCGLLTRRMCF